MDLTPRRDLLAALLPITRALRRVEEVAAARENLTMWQYAILSVVAIDTGLNQREVADRLGYSRNRIVADLDLLERRSLLTRRPGDDRRANVLAITAEGDAVRRAVQAAIHEGEDVLLDGLAPGERDGFAAVAYRLAERARTSAV